MEISLIMEYADGGSLYEILHKQKVKLACKDILSYACDVASGLAYLHKRRVLHRDLKSANVLVRQIFELNNSINPIQLFDGKTLAKIADFGHSRFLNERSLAKTVAGTNYFMAPEVLAEEPYNQSADIYSYVVTL